MVDILLAQEPTSVDKTGEALNRLNSLDSAEEIVRAVTCITGRRVVGMRIARRVITKKMELGRFVDLAQVSQVPGIGIKRLAIIVYALASRG